MRPRLFRLAMAHSLVGRLFAAEGGAVPEMPEGATPGGAIPGRMSPSGGRAPDDVPAMLTAGEFVVPKDVLSWKGEEFFQKTIENARKAKDGATAKPTVARAPAIPPAFMSRPAQQAAIPMR